MPWLVTVLVGMGAATAAVCGSLGVPGASPGAWASRVVTATRAAGSARVRTVITTWPSGSVRRVTERSTGVVDLSDNAYRLTTRTTSEGPPIAPTLVAMGIGDRSYVRLSPGHPSMWHLSIETGIERALDANGRVFGVLLHPTAIWQVGDSRSSVDGTTRFRLTVRTPTPLCVPMTFRPPSLQVWLDGHGRLVRWRLVTRFRVRTAPGVTGIPWQTSVETVELSHFGAPVAIGPPPAGQVRRSAGYSSTLTFHPSCPT